MDQSAELVAVRNDALRKIGRNVVNFQKVETCLKYLIAVSDVQSTRETLIPHQEKRTARIRKLPLGKLSEAFYESVYGAEPEPTATTDRSKISLSTSFRVEADAATLDQRRRTLSKLVAERNKLIHKDLSGFDRNSISHCRSLSEALDLQNVRILQQLDDLKILIDTFKEHIAALKARADGDAPERLSRQISDDA
jgi:hypothetical protein